MDVLARALADLNVVARSELKLKPEQEVAVKSLLDGKDVLAVLPTGYGKSLIYQMQNEVDKPTRLLRFVAFVQLPFSFRSFDLFCRFTLVYEGHLVLCCKEKIEPLDHVMANFKRS